jgi:hypothetical protein
LRGRVRVGAISFDIWFLKFGFDSSKEMGVEKPWISEWRGAKPRNFLVNFFSFFLSNLLNNWRALSRVWIWSGKGLFPL